MKFHHYWSTLENSILLPLGKIHNSPLKKFLPTFMIQAKVVEQGTISCKKQRVQIVYPIF